jgi:hypothetical protein
VTKSQRVKESKSQRVYLAVDQETLKLALSIH